MPQLITPDKTTVNFQTTLSRVLVILFLMTILIAAVANGVVQSAPSSLLPATTINASALNLSLQQKRVNFEMFETALERVELTNQTDVPINSALESILQQATQPFLEEPFVTEGLHAETLARIQFLTRKSFPDGRGETIAALFPVYYQYKTQELKVIGNDAPENLQQEIERFEKGLALQHGILGGELTEKFYGEKNRLAQYLFDRRLITDDATLSETEKKAAIQSLQQAFTESTKTRQQTTP